MKTSASFSLRSPAQGVTPPAAARSLFAAIHPLHRLSRALGLAAFSLQADGHALLRTSRRALAYAAGVTALLLLSGALFFTGMVLVEYPEFAAKSVLANAFTKALHFGTAVAAVCQLCGLRRRHVANALRRVAAADRVLLAGDASRVYQLTYSLLRLQVSLYFVLLTVYFAWDAYVVYKSDDMAVVAWIIYAAGQIPHAFNIALTLQFVNLVCLLLHRFRRINAQLDALLLRYRVARGSRFWRALQEELRRCGAHDASSSGEFPAAAAAVAMAAAGGDAPRMRYRKRAPDATAATRHLRRPRSVSEATSAFSSSLPDSYYSEMDSDYESDDRCECVYDTGFRRSWASASNRTSATSICSDDGVCDVGGDATDSVTRSIGDSENSDASSEDDDDDTGGDHGDDAEKADVARATGRARTSLSPHATDPEDDNSRHRVAESDVDNDAVHDEAVGSRRAEAARRREAYRSGEDSTASRVDVDLSATTVHVATLAHRETDEAKSRVQFGLCTEKESEGTKGSESTGRFGSQGAALARTPDDKETSIANIEKSPESEGKNKHDSHCGSKERDAVKQHTSETSFDEREEDEVGDLPDGNTNLENIPTTERTEYFGMKRPGKEEGLGVCGVESSSSEEGAGARRKGTEEERGRSADDSYASARLHESRLGTEGEEGEEEEEEVEEKGESSVENIRGERSQTRRKCHEGNLTLEDNGKLIIKISNGSDTKIAGDCKRETTLSIDQVDKEKDERGFPFTQPTRSASVDAEKDMERIKNVRDSRDTEHKISEEKVVMEGYEKEDGEETKKCEANKGIKDRHVKEDAAGGTGAVAGMHPSSIQTSVPCARTRRAYPDERTCSPIASFNSTSAAVALSVTSLPTRATDPTRTTVITTTTTATTTTCSKATNNYEPTMSTHVNNSSCRISPGFNYTYREVSDKKRAFPTLMMEPYIATITFNKNLHSNAFRDSSSSLRFTPKNMSTFKPPGITSAPDLRSGVLPPNISCFPVSPSLNSNLTSTPFHKSHWDLISRTNLHFPVTNSNSVPHLPSSSSFHHGTNVNGSTPVINRDVRLNTSNRHVIGADNLQSETSLTPAVKFLTPADATAKESWFDETDSEACGGNCGGAMRLRDLRHCHDALSEAARRLASAFGLPLLLLLAYVFTVTVSCVYHSFISGVQYYAFWLVVNTAQAVAVATACHHCVNASWRPVTLASRALLERPPASVRAEFARLRRQVALGPLRFSACGLFAIDVGVLVGMAGGVASYTVIILQFECSH